jgi:formate dehydrogenase subunit gamma
MTVERYPRSARRYHTAIYVVTLVLLATGWWLLAGREGDPSPIARLTDVPDVQIHTWLGWALLVIAALPLPFAVRGVVHFIRETIRYDRGDLRWLIRLPLAITTGRFARHEGHFDPGQRIANVAIVVLLIALVGSGVGLVVVHVGPLFAVLAAIHRLATIAFTIVIVGHIVVAAGILPGYRGAWRSMHLGGRLRLDTARRLWPGWTDRHLAGTDRQHAGVDDEDAIGFPNFVLVRGHTRTVTPPRLVMRFVWALHGAVRRVSGGRVGTREARGDRIGTLFLHTVGRRSGRPRVNGLFYLDDGPNLVVVGSNAGSDKDPAWWRNLRERPDAHVEIGRRRRLVRARTATADEAATLWPRLDAANPDFATYRANARRSIPVVILEPRAQVPGS